MADINWDELRLKVEEDARKEYDGELDHDECDCQTCRKWSNLGNALDLPELDETDDPGYDFNDEHGILEDNIGPKILSNLAWGNARALSIKEIAAAKEQMNVSDIKCKHFELESKTIGEVYIYPINDYQQVCLCRTCNANLASRIFEQLALETFISKP